MKRCLIIIPTLFYTYNSILPAFERIMSGVKEYKFDTSSVPDDKVTRKIIELRGLRGGFNINEAIDFKLERTGKRNSFPKRN